MEEDYGKVIGQYDNGNYLVTVYEDGTKIRETYEDSFIPGFAESCDVKITDKCNQGCAYCYEGCTSNGKHADLNQPWIDTLHPFTELAINGNDMDHPGLDDFLIKLKEKQVIVNITVNQNQFKANYDRLKKLSDEHLIYGVGVSVLDSSDKVFIHLIKEMPNVVLHVINGVFTLKDIMNLKDNDFKLLILGYKNMGRGKDYQANHDKEVSKNQNILKATLKMVLDGFSAIAFDNLALEQLEMQKVLVKETWEEIYMGDEGSCTFYIDMVKKEFALSSTTEERFPVKDNIDDMFRAIQVQRGVVND